MPSFAGNLGTRIENLHTDKFEFYQKDINRQNFGQQFDKIQMFLLLGSFQHFCQNLPQCVENYPRTFQFSQKFT